MNEHRCATPPTALPGDEWACPVCGLGYWADDTEETWGEGTFEWRPALGDEVIGYTIGYTSRPRP